MQEIETQVDIKQYNEQSCQSEEPAPLPPIAATASTSTEADDSALVAAAALQQLRERYADARGALLNWLEETAELVNNQRPPSADAKAVRAQLQSHDFHTRLIDDKQDR